MNTQIISIIKASIDTKQKVLQDPGLLSTIEKVIERITIAFRTGNRVYFCGNGGSAADAQHLAAEFSGRFYTDRRALPAEALHCNSSYITAVANDYGYDEIYSRLISGIGEKGDILIGLTTSGNSPNIIKAFEAAKEKEITTIAFTGQDGGKIKAVSDYLVNIPSTDTPRIQESHITIGHIICQLVEEKFFTPLPPFDLKNIDKSWTIFLDRDGVINEDRPGSYIFNKDDFNFMEGVPGVFKKMTGKFGHLFVVTNQRGVGRGLITMDDMNATHEKMLKGIKEAGGRIDGIYYATAVNNDDPLRKPNPGMALKAKNDFPSIDFSKSIMLGNKLTDMQFGRNTGMYTIFIATTDPDIPFPHPDIDMRFNLLQDFVKAL